MWVLDKNNLNFVLMIFEKYIILYSIQLQVIIDINFIEIYKVSLIKIILKYKRY